MEPTNVLVGGAGLGGDQRLAGVIEEPLDMIKLSLNRQIYIKLRNDRELTGKLNAFDQHLNMILENAEETHTSVELDEETYEQVYKQNKRTMPMVFIRGDGVILLSTHTGR